MKSAKQIIAELKAWNLLVPATTARLKKEFIKLHSSK